jgi:hypothetical protein
MRLSLNFVEWVGGGERGREKDKEREIRGRVKGIRRERTEEGRFYSGSSE